MRLFVSGATTSLGRLVVAEGQRLGVLLEPANRNRPSWAINTGLPWACDNGCFHGLDALAFRRLLRRVTGQPRLAWVVCPDVVADARATLERFDEWAPELDTAGVPIAFVLQDGQEDLPLPWDRIAAVFVGGSTRFKLSEAAGDLVSEAKARGLWAHMGRVNTRRRLKAAYRIGCDSVDGSSMSRWGDKYITLMLRWLKEIEQEHAQQPLLF